MSTQVTSLDLTFDSITFSLDDSIEIIDHSHLEEDGKSLKAEISVSHSEPADLDLEIPVNLSRPPIASSQPINMETSRHAPFQSFQLVGNQLSQSLQDYANLFKPDTRSTTDTSNSEPASPEETRRNRAAIRQDIRAVKVIAADVLTLVSKAEENLPQLDVMTAEEQEEHVSFWSKFRAFFSNLWRAVKDFFKSAWDGVKSAVRWMGQKIVDACSLVVEAFKQSAEVFFVKNSKYSAGV